jgi:hypothetical protein
MRGIWRRYHTLATDGDAGSAFGVWVFTLFVAPLQRHVTSLLGVSVQVQGVGLPASDSMPYSQSQFGQRCGDGGDSSWCECLGRRRNDRY